MSSLGPYTRLQHGGFSQQLAILNICGNVEKVLIITILVRKSCCSHIFLFCSDICSVLLWFLFQFPVKLSQGKCTKLQQGTALSLFLLAYLSAISCPVSRDEVLNPFTSYLLLNPSLSVKVNNDFVQFKKMQIQNLIL